MDNTTDEKANLRIQAAALLFQAGNQAAEVQRAIDSIHGNSGLRSRLAAVATQLASIEGELSGALNSVVFSLRPADLSFLQGSLSSENAEGLIAEAVAEASTETIRAITAASIETRREVESLHRDIFEDRIFDSYLHFTSPEDEAAFHGREATSRRYIETQLARGTPEGDLNAGGGTESQMLDLYAHGAGDSPEFMPRWNALTERTGRQRTLMHAAGQSTAEYDHTVTNGVRSFLKARGLSDADVAARLATTGDPIEAAKPFLRVDGASGKLQNPIISADPAVAPSGTSSRVGATEGAPTQDAQLSINFDAISAKLQAAGLHLTDGTEPAAGHGLGVQKSTAKTQPVVGN